MAEKPCYEELEEKVRGLEAVIQKQKKKEESFIKRESRLLSIANKVPEMLFQFVMHKDGSFSVPYFNDRVYQYTGYRPEEIEKDPSVLGNSVYPDDIEFLKEKLFHSVNTMSELSVEHRLIGADKKVRWIHARSIPQLMENGDIHWDGISFDISEQKKIEEELKASQKKYQTLFDRMLDGFSLHEIICDKEGNPADYRFLDVNPAFEKITGYKADEILGKTILEIMPETENFLIKTFGRVALTGEPVYFERSTTDKLQHYEISVFQPEKDQFACIFQDATARKNAQKGLEESQEYLKAIMKNTSDYIVIRDKKGYPVLFNSAAQEITKKAMGVNLDSSTMPHRLLGDKKEIAFWDSLHNKALDGEGFRIEYSYEVVPGDLRHFEINFNPIIQDNEVHGFIQVARDITDRKEMQEVLKKSRDDLEKSVKARTKELSRANKELHQKTVDLQDLNTALKVLLERREKDKEIIGENIILNVKELMIPYILRLKKGPLTENQKTYLELLESGLEQIISPFTQKLTSRYLHITPGEMQVANLVKQGKTSKEIADVLNSTERAVEAHRSNLRKKLDLDKKTNLRTYLLSLQ